jgi:hypothetical protein
VGAGHLQDLRLLRRPQAVGQQRSEPRRVQPATVLIKSCQMSIHLAVTTILSLPHDEFMPFFLLHIHLVPFVVYFEYCHTCYMMNEFFVCRSMPFSLHFPEHRGRGGSPVLLREVIGLLLDVIVIASFSFVRLVPSGCGIHRTWLRTTVFGSNPSWPTTFYRGKRLYFLHTFSMW